MSTNSIRFSDFIQVAQGLTDFHVLKIENGRVASRRWTIDDLFRNDKQQNEQVWRLFKQAILSEYGQQRIERICQKYSLNLEDLSRKGAPLLPSDIDKISVGVSNVFSADLCEQEDMRAEWLTPQQIHEKVERLRRNAFTLRDERFSFWQLPLLRSIVPQSTFFFDRMKSMLWSKLSGVSYHSYLEIVSKWIGNLELEEGSLLPMPSSEGSTDYFRVHKKIIKEGLVAYALKPVSEFSLANPLIVFRPTITSVFAEDAPQTWLNDVEVHIGEMGFRAAKSELNRLVNDRSFCPSDKKIDVAGYSLGAVHAQRFVSSYWKKVENAFFFNGPSVESSLSEDFAKTINRLPANCPELSLSIEVFRTRGDLAHFVGEKHIGWGISHPKVRREVLEVDFIEREMETRFSIIAYLRRHLHLFLLDRDFAFVAQRHPGENVDIELDNTVDGSLGKYWEGMRITIGCLMLYPVIYLIHKVFFFTHRYLHFSFFRYSAPQYRYLPLFTPRAPDNILLT